MSHYHRYESGETIAFKGLYLISQVLKVPLSEFFVQEPASNAFNIYSKDNVTEARDIQPKTEADIDKEIIRKLRLINVPLKVELLTFATLLSRANPAEIAEQLLDQAVKKLIIDHYQ